jgi:polysaccharide export outer membrane protein
MRLLWGTLFCLLASGQVKLASAPEQGGNLPPQPVGPHDLLAVNVYGAPELSRTLRVSAGGEIRLPMLKRAIEVRGRMPGEIEERIAAALAAEQILVDPVVTVTIAEIASRPVQVAGAVKKPVTFQAHGQTTLLDALARAEGLAEDAGQEILVRRPARDGAPGLTQRIAVRDLIEAADPAANLPLEGGEEIRVPEVGRVFVVGNLVRPGAIPLDDAGGMSVMKALAMSGGLDRFAAKQAFIYRLAADGAKQEIKVELRRLLDRKVADVELRAGDIFYVPDNRRGRLTATVIDRVVAFGAGTASGALILSSNRR